MSRSLTIKQMAMIASIVTVSAFIFIVLQLSYFIQQNRSDTAAQLEDIALSLRGPLSRAVLKADVADARMILQTLQPSGVVSQVNIMLPDELEVLQLTLSPPSPVPAFITQLFSLPIQSITPLYALPSPGKSAPVAYLVLKADAHRAYHVFMSMLSTLLTTYLLLALILTVSITWGINRLIVHPVSRIARALQAFASDHGAMSPPLLPLPESHKDDEIGLLIRSYNRYQAMHSAGYDPTFLVSKAQFMDRIIVSQATEKPGALLIIRHDSVDESTLQYSDILRAHLLQQMDNHPVLFPEKRLIADLHDNHSGLLMNGIHDPWKAMSFAQQVMACFGRDRSAGYVHDETSLCIGIAMLHPEVPATELYQRAWSACITARQRGHHQIQFYDVLSDTRTSVGGMRRDHKRQGGLDTRQFAIWLQPQVNMLSGELVGAEVLLRQRQPDAQWRLPEGLISCIEECGLMIAIGNWVLKETCRILADWQQRGVVLPLYVNLSVLQLMDNTVQPVLEGLMNHYGIQRGTLNIEITESQNIDDPEAVVHRLKSLHAAGIHIAIDDFGMGYAGLRALQYLKAIPVDTLKIDKSFINGLPEEHVMSDIIIMMARTLEMNILAEGVEYEQQKVWLLEQGVRYAQGYLFSEPLALCDFEQRYLRPAENEGIVPSMRYGQSCDDVQ